MVKILLGFFAVFHPLCATQDGQYSRKNSFNACLNTFINNLDKHEGVVDNLILFDFRRGGLCKNVHSTIDKTLNNHPGYVLKKMIKNPYLKFKKNRK